MLDSRLSVWLGAAAGALAGAALGYLFLTPNGRRLREDLEPEIAELIRQLKRVSANPSPDRQDA